MSKTIILRNMSGQSQKFYVRGWNGNRDAIVPARSEVRFNAPDGSSGAIIAVHDGFEGEQAEITKKGFGGNDFFDISVIVGAGGNMIAQQVGDNSTRKGAPRFMQDLNAAWAKASQQTKNDLKNCVHLRNGKVVRISAPKNFPKLEQFVRTFANGKVYIGVGATPGKPGNPNDDKNSSAAKGSKDILVCYNDGDATPQSGAKGFAAGPIPDESTAMEDAEVETTETPTEAAESEPAAAAAEEEVKEEPKTVAAASTEAETETPEETTSADDTTPEPAAAPRGFAPMGIAAAAVQPGIQLTNKTKQSHNFYFYDNYWNGNGTAGANFDKPLKNIVLAAGKSAFVPLPASFKGRVQRGTQLPCTWAEFQLEASNDKAAHGDISLQQGCDGPVTIASMDGSNRINGLGVDFVNVVKNAPEAAIRKKPNGERAIDTTVGNWMGGPNKAAIDYLNRVVGQKRAYILGGSGTPDVASKDRRMAVVFY
ncbi:hypothetical protein QBC35DRAFT_495038 [Podospora australis]|uniref:Uncharacterized protein n=1 Tax=Podospora australis TaxID=1536484 RepID=A0AAN6WX21_9PEZI|nr:hypothetical protein QBC35DRAFT_495038 [Podospora australis]